MAKTHGICGGGQDEGPGTGAEAARSETVGVAWEGGRRQFACRKREEDEDRRMITEKWNNHGSFL